MIELKLSLRIIGFENDCEIEPDTFSNEATCIEKTILGFVPYVD